MALQQINSFYRFLFLALLSAALMIVDQRSELLHRARTAGMYINWPFEQLSGAPGALQDLIARHYPDSGLPERYAELQARHAILQARLQKYDAVVAENRRLSELLAMPHKPGVEILFAEIVKAGLDAFAHRVALNRGVEAGVYLGQPAITPDGVLGQVSGVGLHRSVVTLITDPSHALPVQIQRNGLRAVIKGAGNPRRVEVPFLSAQADIQQGDVLVTSGLGGGFPAGYKVAQVEEIIADTDAVFLTISAIAFADMQLAKEVLLLWKEQRDGYTGRDELPDAELGDVELPDAELGNDELHDNNSPAGAQAQ